MTNNQSGSNKKTVLLGAALTAATLTSLGLAGQVMAAPFQLNAESKSFIENPPPMQSSAGYSAPGYQPGTATYDTNPNGGQALNANINQNQNQSRPLQASTQRSVQLPPQFMGAWSVSGKCTGIDALPQFQQGVGKLFQQQTQNTWRISGDGQQGYQISSDTGASFPLIVYKASKNTAMVRYQHPTYNTMSQEAIVMQLENGGATFQGLERISIVKDGQQPPRAKVTYQLFGQRQQ